MQGLKRTSFIQHVACVLPVMVIPLVLEGVHLLFVGGGGFVRSLLSQHFMFSHWVYRCILRSRLVLCSRKMENTSGAFRRRRTNTAGFLPPTIEMSTRFVPWLRFTWFWGDVCPPAFLFCCAAVPGPHYSRGESARFGPTNWDLYIAKG